MPRRNLFALVMIGAVSLLCWQTTRGAGPRDKDDAMELYGVFVDAVEQVQANYVREVSRRELLESALRGMLQHLDPHSAYINELDLKRFKRDIEGSFSGIGIQVDIDDQDRLRVIAPLEGSPAAEAGILAGDLIMEIDGKSTDGFTTMEAVDALKGRPGTGVTLKVLHKGNPRLETIALNRAIIEVPSVEGVTRAANLHWNYMLDKDKKIGYIRITSFIQKTTEELQKALAELQQQGMKALVLDLRDNPGGLLSSAVEVSDLFVESGTIVSTKGRNTTERVFEAEKDGTYSGFPMAVIINEGSASAAEIVSACLQDKKRAAIVGQRSYGKGSVQNILDLEDGNSVLKLTVAAYMRPSGKNIHRFKDAKETDAWGVSPDESLEVKYTPEEHMAWILSRRDPNSSASAALRRRLNRDRGEPKDAPKPDGDQSKAAPEGAGRRPFVDKQLEKAVSYLKEKLGAGDDQEQPKD